MGKVIKYILLTLLALIILAAIGIGILVYTVNPNQLKAPITQQIESMTGRTTVIEGNIAWKFFPWLAISIKQVQLSNAPGFNQNVPFMELKEANVSLKVLPLLTGNIEFGKITLDGLNLNLSTNKQGVNNWADLLKNHPTKIDANAAPVSIPVPVKTTPISSNKSEFNLKPLDLSISSINISNSSIRYDNQKENHKTHKYFQKLSPLLHDRNFQVCNRQKQFSALIEQRKLK